MTTPVRFLVIALSAGTMTRMATLKPSPSTAGQPACVTARNWVRTHPEALSSSYDVYSDYPIAWQKAIYTALSTPQRVALWQAQLDHVMATVELTPAQRSFLESARENLPSTFGADLAARRREEARAERVLGKDLTRLAFYNLGDAYKPAAAEGTQCFCGGYPEDPCHSGYYCKNGGCDQVSGCGYKGQDVCDGTCYSPNSPR